MKIQLTLNAISDHDCTSKPEVEKTVAAPKYVSVETMRFTD
jgi:hypothetical protein